MFGLSCVTPASGAGEIAQAPACGAGVLGDSPTIRASQHTKKGGKHFIIPGANVELRTEGGGNRDPLVLVLEIARKLRSSGFHHGPRKETQSRIWNQLWAVPDT